MTGVAVRGNLEAERYSLPGYAASSYGCGDSTGFLCTVTLVPPTAPALLRLCCKRRNWHPLL